MISLSAIAEALGGEVSGGQVLAPGPGHSDGDRSLSVKPAADAPDGLLVHSFAGDDPIMCKRYVLDRLGRKPKGGGTKRRTTKRLVAQFDYCGADGALRSQAVRYEPKSFAQRRPLPGEPGRWIWGLTASPYLRGRNGDFYVSTPERVLEWKGAEYQEFDACEPVLYRLPELVEAVALGHPVLVPEGEGKVDRLRELGLAATCNAMGAGKWRDDPEFNAPLRGANLVLMPDNDQVGRKHAEEVGRILSGVAARIRVLELPNLAEGGDVKDWLRDGGSREELDELVAHAPEIADDPRETPEPNFDPSDDGQTEPKTPPLAFSSAARWQDVPVPPRRWLVLNRVLMREVTGLSGDGGIGKTTIALQLAAACGAKRTDWLGAVIDEPGPTMFYTAEEPEAEIHFRLDKIREHRGLAWADLEDVHTFCAIEQPELDPALAAARNGIVTPTPTLYRLTEAVLDIKPKLLVVESAADAFAVNEIDRQQARACVRLLQRIGMRADCAVMLLSHPSQAGVREGTGTSGSTQWNNCYRSRLYLATPGKDDDRSGIKTLQVMKNNRGPLGEPVSLFWEDHVFKIHAGKSPLHRMAAEAAVDDVFLKCLDVRTAQKRPVGPNKGPNYAPAKFAEMPDAAEMKSEAFAASMERLLKAERIRIENVGSPSRSKQVIARAEPT